MLRNTNQNWILTVYPYLAILRQAGRPMAIQNSDTALKRHAVFSIDHAC